MTLHILNSLSETLRHLRGPSIDRRQLIQGTIRELITKVVPTKWTITCGSYSIQDDRTSVRIVDCRDGSKSKVTATLVEGESIHELVLRGRQARQLLSLLRCTIAQEAAVLDAKMHSLVEQLQNDPVFVESLAWRELERNDLVRREREFLASFGDFKLRLSFQSALVPGYQMEINLSKAMDPIEARNLDSNGRNEAICEYLQEQRYRSTHPHAPYSSFLSDPELRIAAAGFSAFCGRHQGAVLEINTAGLPLKCGSTFKSTREFTENVSRLYAQVSSLSDS